MWLIFRHCDTDVEIKTLLRLIVSLNIPSCIGKLEGESESIMAAEIDDAQCALQILQKHSYYMKAALGRHAAVELAGQPPYDMVLRRVKGKAEA